MEQSTGKSKRQFEIMGIALYRPREFTPDDFSLLFNVGTITIMRDLGDMRNLGIDIHAVNNKGVELRGKIEKGVLSAMIPDYIASSNSTSPFRPATEHLINSRGEESIIVLTLIQRAIDNGRNVTISFSDRPDEIKVKPINIYHTDEDWFLVCEFDKIKHLYRISKITKVTPSESLCTVRFQLAPNNKLLSTNESRINYFIEDLKLSNPFIDDTILVDEVYEDLMQKAQRTQPVTEAHIRAVREAFLSAIQKSDGEVRKKIKSLRNEVLRKLLENKF